MDVELWKVFLGWCTVINGGLLVFSSVALIIGQKAVLAIHSKLFAANEADLIHSYFSYLAHFKLLFIVFNLVPYLALCLANS